MPRLSPKTPSQAAIGRVLGLSRASMTKYKAKGMPMHSVDAAHQWREQHTAPTMHRRVAPYSPSLQHALALMGIAAAGLTAGKSIGPMVPMLRAALHAVPSRERSDTMRLPADVLTVLVADVHALLKGDDDDRESADGAGSSMPMTDEEAKNMGDFWYSVAAGEIQPAPHSMT